MNLPNKLTTFRVLLMPVFILFMEFYQNSINSTQKGYNVLIALIIFAIASFTDFLDGYIARRDNLVTDFGKFMDPLADKVLTTVAFVYLLTLDYLSPIVLLIVLTREFIVSGIRMVAATSKSGGVVIAASFAGKAKTVLQMFSIVFALVVISGTEMQSSFFIENLDSLRFAIDALMWAMAAATAISGAQYVIPYTDILKDNK